MAGSLNKVMLMGNLGRDPEIRHANDGSRIGNLNLATSESWKDKATGERKERTEWHRVVIFNPNLVDIAEKYLRKGSKVLVEGQLQTRKWTDGNGVEKYTTEVVISRFKGELTMMGSANDNGGGGYGGGDASMGGGSSYGSGSAPSSTPLASGGLGQSGPSAAPQAAPAPMDDEVPF